MTNKVLLLLKALLAVFAGMALSSCVQDEPEATSLSVSPDISFATFSADGRTLYSGEEIIGREFSVLTDGPGWDVTVDGPGWCRAEKTGDTTFELSADPNLSAESSPSPSMVTVTSGSLSKDIIVIQKVYVPEPEYVTIDFGKAFPAGKAVTAIVGDGVTVEVEFDSDEPSTGRIRLDHGGLVRSLQMDGGPVLPVGRIAGEETVRLWLGPSGELAGLPADSDGALLVGTVAAFDFIAASPSSGKSYRQEADIDMMGIERTPIGPDVANPFIGNFDGAGYEIRNINVISATYTGLFGVCAYGTIENVNIVSGSVSGDVGNPGTGSGYAGAICGYGQDMLVRGCVNRAAVSGYMWVGGIIGVASGGQSGTFVENCGNYGAVNGITGGSFMESSMIGGICGYVLDGCQVSDCENHGAVGGHSGVGGIAGYNDGVLRGCVNEGEVRGEGLKIMFVASSTGGICGSNGTAEGSAAVIEDCLNRGGVDAYGLAGGLTGSNFGSILASKNAGDIESDFSENGGLAGRNDGAIGASYSVGTVSGADRSAGMVGTNAGSLNACYTVSEVVSNGDESAVAVGADAGGTMTACFLAAGSSLPAVGNAQDCDGLEVFGDSSWPDASMSGWGVGADYDGGKFWKSLGKYSSVSPEYPQLNWE